MQYYVYLHMKSNKLGSVNKTQKTYKLKLTKSEKLFLKIDLLNKILNAD